MITMFSPCNEVMPGFDFPPAGSACLVHGSAVAARALGCLRGLTEHWSADTPPAPALAS